MTTEATLPQPYDTVNVRFPLAVGHQAVPVCQIPEAMSILIFREELLLVQ